MNKLHITVKEIKGTCPVCGYGFDEAWLFRFFNGAPSTAKEVKNMD